MSEHHNPIQEGKQPDDEAFIQAEMAQLEIDLDPSAYRSSIVGRKGSDFDSQDYIDYDRARDVFGQYQSISSAKERRISTSSKIKRSRRIFNACFALAGAYTGYEFLNQASANSDVPEFLKVTAILGAGAIAVNLIENNTESTVNKIHDSTIREIQDIQQVMISHHENRFGHDASAKVDTLRSMWELNSERVVVCNPVNLFQVWEEDAEGRSFS